MTVSLETRRNPYVGPRPFETGETLYGRDLEIRKLLDLLIAERVVLLYSPSGAGKTSLLRAALIPALEREKFRVLPVMRVNLEPPPTAPQDPRAFNRYVFSALSSLDAELPVEQQSPPDELTTLELAAYLDRRRPAAENPQNEVLIFDQFEEILTVDPTNQTARAAFFAQVGAALRDHPRWALFSMREDYVAALDPYLRSVPTRLGNTFRLDLLGVAAARLAIQGPALRAGKVFTEAATNKLINDLRRVRVQGAGGRTEEREGLHVEPVQLQVVCRRLWEKFPDRIEETDLEAVGDVDSALADYYAERVAAAARDHRVGERAIREWFDHELITPQGIRGQVLQGPGCSHGLDNRVVSSLVNAHLVRAENRRGATWFELTHDRLLKPVRENNTAWLEANLSPLQRRAELWEHAGRPDGLLLADRELVDAERWADAHREDLRPIESAFLAACREEREQAEAARRIAERERRQARRIRMLAVVALLAVLAALYAYNRSKQQEEIARSRQGLILAAQALDRLDQLDLALLLSLEARRLDPSLEPLGSLLSALGSNPKLTAFLRGHVDRVTSVAFSPDGRTVASGSWDRSIVLWDVATMRPLGQPFQGHEAVWSVAFSPEGRTLAAGGCGELDTAGDCAPGEAGVIRLWDVAKGEPIGEPLTGHSNAVFALAFSPDGQTLASGGVDSKVILWDVASRRPLGRPLEGHTGRVSSVAFSPGGKTLASAGQDGTIVLWDVPTGQPIGRPLAGHRGWVRSVAFSPDGQTLASGSGDSMIVLWDVGTRQPRHSIAGHRDTVSSVAFSPDGKKLASGSVDKTIRVWDLATHQPVGEPLTGHTNWVWSVAFSPNGHTLVSGSFDDTVILWDLATVHRLGRSLAGPPEVVTSVAFSPDGTTLASGTADDSASKVVLWYVATQQPLGPPLVGHRAWVWSVALSPDGKTVASGGCGEVGPGGTSCIRDGEIRLWDVTTGEPIGQPLVAHVGGVRSVAFSPDGKVLASAGCGKLDAAGRCIQGEIRLWDAETPQLRDQLVVDGAEGVWSVAFSPDGKTLAAGVGIEAVKFWDVQSREPRDLPILHTGRVWSVTFSPDGKTLASGSEDGGIVLWDVATGEPIRQPLADHVGGIRSVAFSPDGHLLASGSGDKTIILWDVAEGRRIGRPLKAHDESVRGVAFSPDRKTLASGGVDSRVILWDVSVESWEARACTIAGRNLTSAEWQRFLSDRPYRKTCPDLPGPE